MVALKKINLSSWHFSGLKLNLLSLTCKILNKMAFF